ncbi:hypothetical protein FRC17_005553 [Serendipita sp. 399]|nr:hypothetical protein FRC17_005553 [Serendipita sp. 399]
MDIFHSENTYVVTVELPSLQKSDVDLGVKDDVLTISGEFPSRKDGDGGDGGDEAAQDIFDYMEDDMYHVMVDDEGEEITLMEQPSDRKVEQQASTSGGAGGAAEKGKYILHERPVGKFKRSIRLPPWVDVDAIKATMSDGVLTLALEKPAPSKKDDGTRKINIL